MAYEFKLTRRVEFSETDMAGIMHFSNYFRFMESAEGAFFRSLGFSVVLARNGLDVGLPRVHAECDYRAPLKYEDEVLIHLLVEKKSHRSLTYQFRFYRLNGPEPKEVARGKVIAVCAAHKGSGPMHAVSIPEALAAKIEAAPAELLSDVSPVRDIQMDDTRAASKSKHAKANHN